MTINNGIHASSSATGGETFVIFALDHGHEYPASYVGIKKLTGSYKGETETSYICSWDTFTEQVKPSGKVDNQESFLVLGPTVRNSVRPATLFFNNANVAPVNLGYFQSVSQEEAERQDGWSYDATQGQYYVCLHNAPERLIPRRNDVAFASRYQPLDGANLSV
tara:strand:- start:304 stop:795 length:492 start_codon:yes stop_codon:yes gene_type:complete